MSWKVILAILTCNVVLMSASYTMLIPFLPMYLIQELGVEAEHVNIWSGLVFSATFVVSAVMAPIWGKLADQKGKKLMAVRSSMGLALTYFFGGLVSSPEELLIVRIFQGFAAGLWAAELAIMSTVAPKEKLGLSLGVMQAALTGGGVIGPLLGGVLAQLFGMRMSFFFASASLFIITLVTVFFVPESKREDRNAAGGEPQAPPKLLKTPIIRRMLIYSAVVQMVILILQPILTIYVAELQKSMDNIVMIAGIVFSLGGIAGAISAPLWGRYGQCKGFLRTLRLALACAGIIMMTQSLPDTLLPFAMLQFTCGLFFAGIYPSINALLAKNTEAAYRGRIFGMMFSAQQIGSMAGPLLGGLIGTYIGLKSVFLFAGFLLAGISVLLKLRPVEGMKE